MVTWLVRVLVTVLVLGSAGTAVFLNLPVHPPTGFTSPTGTAAAPEIVSRITGRVLSARRVVETAGAPAVAVDFLTPSRGWAITGCGYARTARDVRTGEFRLCTIRSTLNSGLSWRVQWTTLRQLSGISFVTNLDGYTWTGSGVCPTASCPTRLYGTANGGRTWTLRFIGSAAWTSLVVTGPNTLWGTVGGELLRSVDGGRTWQLQTVHGCIPEKVAFDGNTRTTPDLDREYLLRLFLPDVRGEPLTRMIDAARRGDRPRGDQLLGEHFDLPPDLLRRAGGG